MLLPWQLQGPAPGLNHAAYPKYRKGNKMTTEH